MAKCDTVKIAIDNKSYLIINASEYDPREHVLWETILQDRKEKKAVAQKKAAKPEPVKLKEPEIQKVAEKPRAVPKKHTAQIDPNIEDESPKLKSEAKK